MHIRAIFDRYAYADSDTTQSSIFANGCRANTRADEIGDADIYSAAIAYSYSDSIAATERDA